MSVLFEYRKPTRNQLLGCEVDESGGPHNDLSAYCWTWHVGLAPLNEYALAMPPQMHVKSSAGTNWWGKHLNPTTASKSIMYERFSWSVPTSTLWQTRSDFKLGYLYAEGKGVVTKKQNWIEWVAGLLHNHRPICGTSLIFHHDSISSHVLLLSYLIKPHKFHSSRIFVDTF